MRRLLYLLAVISISLGAIPAAPLPAQARPSAKDTLAYTTATVRLREKPLPTARALAVLRQGTPVRLSAALWHRGAASQGLATPTPPPAGCKAPFPPPRPPARLHPSA
jgi:hypothetical protein